MQQVLEAFGDRDRFPDPEGDVAHLGGGDRLVGGELIGDAVGVDLGRKRRAGASRPRATPAMVAWMPDSKVASQIADAERRRRREVADPGPAQHGDDRTSPAAAAASQRPSMPSE